MRNIVRFVVAIVTSLAVVQSLYSGIEMYNKDISIPIWLYVILVLSIGIMIFCCNGLWLEGYLRKKAKITIKSIGMEVNIKRGDLFKETGVIVIGVNDFFDTIVDDTHISSRSLHGMMILKHWGGNVGDLDSQIQNGLASNVFESVKRDGIAKEKRYPLGTSVLVKDSHGKRFLLVALTRTNAVTHRTHAELRDLYDAVKGSLTVARETANGDPVSLPLMGGGNARIKAPKQALFNVMLSSILSECLENEKVSSQINIVLHPNSLKGLNLFAIEKEWVV
jgi:hypothetical protein